MMIRYPTVDESVPLLVPLHFALELVEAVLNDEDGMKKLLEVCGGVSGGDDAAISMLFRDLSNQFDQDPAAADEILDAWSPAAMLAEKVKAQNERTRVR